MQIKIQGAHGNAKFDSGAPLWNALFVKSTVVLFGNSKNFHLTFNPQAGRILVCKGQGDNSEVVNEITSVTDEMVEATESFMAELARLGTSSAFFEDKRTRGIYQKMSRHEKLCMKGNELKQVAEAFLWGYILSIVWDDSPEEDRQQYLARAEKYNLAQDASYKMNKGWVPSQTFLEGVFTDEDWTIFRVPTEDDIREAVKLKAEMKRQKEAEEAPIPAKTLDDLTYRRVNETITRFQKFAQRVIGGEKKLNPVDYNTLTARSTFLTKWAEQLARSPEGTRENVLFKRVKWAAQVVDEILSSPTLFYDEECRINLKRAIDTRNWAQAVMVNELTTAKSKTDKFLAKAKYVARTVWAHVKMTAQIIWNRIKFYANKVWNWLVDLFDTTKAKVENAIHPKAEFVEAVYTDC